jgi:DNA-directed RNA polymerase subunit RPC12/RpoP
MGIREDMLTYKDTIAEPLRQYIYEGYCSCKDKNRPVVIVRERKSRMTECPHCGYVLLWKSKEVGVSFTEGWLQNYAREQIAGYKEHVNGKILKGV